ncbi:hypothetical protein A2454_00880 [Candidatus Peribacteria bacterium RIFOXYC2_FULL_55_14]|nr:MAG: PAS/PAC sensor hybrid histidine kinase [Candidatus Peribacteria bacterium GW2011_GWB1_54_5]KKW39434.1 MAG: PAS/PAC sensor hybrid histidine kinase [Candidatus Peribacteria bacterium GW2011_GWC2_54_8]KKW42415.1 MAG: PAS/PAC sensor hybrid histidine kinase [Candidatus Peregrinibacteria bacterium GW2011_GWA2_54_9]OGJ71634.1 MAG: hypothetical protein A2198_05540 [Candidatus Peribacteria bacterium RIFOXYA1_FULL_56_14]OGJ73030.1 MAG: hypothetical protein A2217_07055 [Candidatus Peribacteria bac
MVNTEKQTQESSGLVADIMPHFRVVAVVVSCALLAAGITYILYNYTQVLLKERMQERLVAIVSTAARTFEVSDIQAIEGNELDIGKPELERIVGQLGAMREANPDITYAYMMRRTDDPNVVAFVADADSLLSAEELDINDDGEVDDTEVAPLPGDLFDVNEYPTLNYEAFYHPVAANELEEDQWSVQLSAYAPIFDSAGDTVAIVGIDVTIENFKQRTQTMLLPFLLFIFFLIALLTLLTLLLIRFYGERVRAMREIDRQKDELLSIVSHQLATPVSSAKWYLEMLQDGDVGKLTPKQGEHVHSIQGIAENLTDLVSMILDVSRVQLGRMQVDREALDLSEFFKEILTVIEPKAEEKKVKFSVSLPEKLPVAMLDRRLMRMTLENLLSNAVKYTPEKGSVELRVTVKDDVLEYIVKDTGCGIPKAEQKKMFTKLFRASNVLNVSGNGFGLFVAKGAVEAQGGSISFVSAGGEGTTFTVAIPLITPKEGQK